ncbi:MAG TPA: hypothetical protein VLG50_00725 [Candidatus Saccharimonadales bacterium]|nr:hypothetical protein [Candidatus Saccharimonadales bacterium]
MKKVLLFVMLFSFVSTTKVECIVGAKATAFLAGCVVGSGATIGALAQTINDGEKKVYLELLKETLRKSEENLRNRLKIVKN